MAANASAATALSSSSCSFTTTHRSREAAVIADAVRRLNRRICLIDQVATGGASEVTDSALERALECLPTPPSLPLVKVYSVGNCVAYALLEAVSWSTP